MRLRDYAGPLGILAAGVIGFSLLCSVSALAMSDLNTHSLTTLEPLNFVDLAIDNLSTAAALTEQAVTAFVPTPTVVPTNTASPAPLPSDTATVTARPTFTSRPPTRTRSSDGAILPVPTRTSPPLPTATRILPPPTNTATRPPPTNTPPPTSTPLPPTETAVPPSNTPDPPTNTAAPLPTTEPPTPADTLPAPTEPPVQFSDPTSTPSQ